MLTKLEKDRTISGKTRLVLYSHTSVYFKPKPRLLTSDSNRESSTYSDRKWGVDTKSGVHFVTSTLLSPKNDGYNFRTANSGVLNACYETRNSSLRYRISEGKHNCLSK